MRLYDLQGRLALAETGDVDALYVLAIGRVQALAELFRLDLKGDLDLVGRELFHCCLHVHPPKSTIRRLLLLTVFRFYHMPGYFATAIPVTYCNLTGICVIISQMRPTAPAHAHMAALIL